MNWIDDAKSQNISEKDINKSVTVEINQTETISNKVKTNNLSKILPETNPNHSESESPDYSPSGTRRFSLGKFSDHKFLLGDEQPTGSGYGKYKDKVTRS